MGVIVYPYQFKLISLTVKHVSARKFYQKISQAIFDSFDNSKNLFLYSVWIAISSFKKVHTQNVAYFVYLYAFMHNPTKKS